MDTITRVQRCRTLWQLWEEPPQPCFGRVMIIPWRAVAYEEEVKCKASMPQCRTNVIPAEIVDLSKYASDSSTWQRDGARHQCRTNVIPAEIFDWSMNASGSSSTWQWHAPRSNLQFGFVMYSVMCHRWMPYST